MWNTSRPKWAAVEASGQCQTQGAEDRAVEAWCAVPRGHLLQLEHCLSQHQWWRLDAQQAHR